MVTMPLQSDTLSCKLNNRLEVVKLIEGLALGTTGTSASPTSIWTTPLIVGRDIASGCEQAKPTIRTLLIEHSSNSPSSLGSAALNNLPS
ncbi:hypothetical protein GQ457_11G007740 [Hibiscus cannabinus]